MSGSSRLFHIDNDCVCNVIDRLDLVDVCHLLQTGCRLLRDRIVLSGGVKRINITSGDDERALREFMPKHVDDIFRNVMTIDVVDGAFSDALAYTRVLKRLFLPSLCVLDAPNHWASIGKKASLPNLHTLRIGRIQPKSTTMLEVVLPSLTSLEWCDQATSRLPELGDKLVSQLRVLKMKKINASIWWLGHYKHWPCLQTLQFATLNAHPNALTGEAFPSLTRLSILDICNIQSLAGLEAITTLVHLKLRLCSKGELPRLSTVRLVPSSVTDLDIDLMHNGLGDEEGARYSDLQHLLIPRLERLVLKNVLRSDETFVLLRELPCLKRLITENDEYCKMMLSDGAHEWRSLVQSLQGTENFAPCYFHSFETVADPTVLHQSIADVALRSRASIGCQMMRRCNILAPDILFGGVALSFDAICSWLSEFTCDRCDMFVVCKWATLLVSLVEIERCAVSWAVRDEDPIAAAFGKILCHHKQRSHPTMFRYLLHLMYLCIVTDGNANGYFEHHKGRYDEAMKLLSSAPYHYTWPLSYRSSEVTLWSLKSFLDLPTEQYDVGDMRLVMDAMDDPHNADLTCRGEVNTCKWFDRFPFWRILRQTRDRLETHFSNDGILLRRFSHRTFDLVRGNEFLRCMHLEITGPNASHWFSLRVTEHVRENKVTVAKWESLLLLSSECVSDAINLFVELSYM